MSDATFDDLKNHPTLGWTVELLEAKYGVPVPENIQRLVLDLATSAEIGFQQTCDWVQKASIITNRIAQGNAHDTEFPLFWIYLNAIVDEFYEEESKYREINEQIGFKKPILDGLDELRVRLSEEDLILIKFMRHSHAHIHLHYVWHRAKVKDGKIVQVKPPFAPNARAITARVISEHNGDQKAVARMYAQKVADSLLQLRYAVDAAKAI